MKWVDLPALARRQLTLDAQQTKRFPALLDRKIARMSASPLAFLRGAAPLFYRHLLATKVLADGPVGDGWIVGDLHLENFGAYRPVLSGKSKKERVVFDLNDFDEATIAPWRFDVLRLTTSLLLGGRELGATGPVAIDLVDVLLDAWCDSAFDGRALPPAPRPVRQLLAQVKSRSRSELLAARTEVVKHKRRFVRGPRYADLSRDVLTALPAALARYLDSTSGDERPHGSFEIVDAALRIAGTGSLGGLRIAVLVEGKGGPEGGWIFDLKEQSQPVTSRLAPPPNLGPAERVVAGFRACVASAPQLMGTTRIGKLSLFGRRLAPQEDKLDLRRIAGPDLRPLAQYLGALLGAAHARGARKVPRRWSKSDLAEIRTNAITLAGLHEGIYLALCDHVRGREPKR